MKYEYDAVVVGSGPNGLAAAITLIKKNLSVVVFEAKDAVGGGARSQGLTLPGFTHDVCSAVHPLGISSPFFQSISLEEHGLEWIQPTYPLAHPFDDGVAVLKRSIVETAETLGGDKELYINLITPLSEDWDKIAPDLLGPIKIPKHPIAFAGFGMKAIRSAKGFSKRFFKGEYARGFFAGLGAHSIVALEKLATSAVGLVLCILGHNYGWPIPKGGSQNISDSLASYFRSLGGEIVLSTQIRSLNQLPGAKVIMFDVTPKQLINIVGDRFPSGYKRKLESYRYGPGAFKIDWALEGPIPWKAEECQHAGTVHLGATLEEIALSERMVWNGQHPENPYTLIAQQSLFDPSRAPQGKHTAWGYCHVPNGSTVDMTQRIENQIERFAPGFKDLIIAKSVKSPLQLEQYNPNYIGGDINGGVQDIWQIFTRPVARIVPYSTPLKNIYICSSSTPPGGGVHGMCGYNAANAAIKSLFS